VTQELWWYTVRSTGLVAWVLVTAAVVWGLLLSLRQIARPRPAWMLDLHRFLGGLTVLFVVAHVVALSFDSFVGFSWADLLIPYSSTWRPGALAWGITAAYLLLAVEITSLLMRHLGRRLWHAIHLFSLVVFVAVTVHGLSAGADADEPLMLGFAIGSSVLVAGLCIARIVMRRAPRRRATPEPAPRVYAPAHAMGVPHGAGGGSVALVATRECRSAGSDRTGRMGSGVDGPVGSRPRG
jgi:predicted ferric reductase